MRNIIYFAAALSFLTFFSARHALAAPGAYAVGDAMVYSLLDAAREMPADIFTGESRDKINKMAPSGSVPASISAFLIQRNGMVVLIDSGLGNSGSLLIRSMERYGFKPEAVTHVLLTHLHGDHVGGLALDGKAAFPNAQIMVAEQEKNFWLDPRTLEEQPGRKGNIDLIKANFALYPGKVKEIQFDAEILPGITALSAVGHTPGHTAFMLASKDKRMLFWGDLAHGADLQFANPKICANFDMNMPQAVRTRVEYMNMAARENIPVAGAHLPEPAVIKVEASDKAFSYRLLPNQ